MTMEELRARIDELDERLVELLNQRALWALEIGKLKQASGLEIYQPEREAEVLRHVQGCSARSRGPLGKDAITRVFERIIDEGRRIERAAVLDSASPGVDRSAGHVNELARADDAAAARGKQATAEEPATGQIGDRRSVARPDRKR